MISAIGSPLTHSRFLECKTIQLSETRMLVRDLVIFVHQKLAFLVFFKLSTAMECRDFLFSGRLFNQMPFSNFTQRTDKLQDLMHRSYNIDKRLAPAFTYTPVYKDPKNSFGLRFSWGPLNGTIPTL